MRRFSCFLRLFFVRAVFQEECRATIVHVSLRSLVSTRSIQVQDAGLSVLTAAAALRFPEVDNREGLTAPA